MTTASATRPRSPALNASERNSIREQMDRIFESPSFRSSPRCQQLLRYLTENALEGRDEMLRERVIGTEVFQRAPAYDTGEDSIVRVRANDLRKRLAQYYDGAPDREHELRIHLPAGSYMPEFAFHVELHVIPATTVRRQVHWLPVLLVIAAVLAFAAVAMTQRFRHARTVIDDFWAPVVSSSKPVLFCLGDAQIFGLSRDLRQRFFRMHPRSGEPEPAAVELAPGDVLHGSDLVSVQGQFVGVGGAQSVQMLSNLLAFRGKTSMLRTSGDLSFADLRQYPTVLIGAFSNRWTLRLSRQLRFYFDETTGTRICDRQRPGVAWEVQLDRNGRELVDYAVIWRLVRSETGQVIIGASGITQYGCTAAGELISNVAYMEQALRNAPSDWRPKNMQVVLRSKVVGKTPGPPEVVATYFW
ncbi:MAG: hypothetical protein ACR2NN_27395 [Bryobacteraceae bacterium]